MRPPILPNPENASLQEIEEAIPATADHKMCKRLEAIRLLVKGFTICQTADIVMRSERVLRRYIKNFNEAGIDGMASVPKPGRPGKVTIREKGDVLGCLENPSLIGESHLTLLKLWGRFNPKFGKQIGYSTFTRMVRNADFRRLIPRPESPERDLEKRENFLKELHFALIDKAVPVWFMDESGFSADPRPKAQWAKKGTKPICPISGKHIRQSVVGAVQPDSGDFVSLIFSRVNTAVFQAFLDEFDKHTDGIATVMVLDNASWHKAKALNWHNIKPLFLAPYSPDHNPIERLWKYMKDNWFAGWYTKTHEELLERLTEALCCLFDDSDRIKSVCKVSVSTC